MLALLEGRKKITQIKIKQILCKKQTNKQTNKMQIGVYVYETYPAGSQSIEYLSANL